MSDSWINRLVVSGRKADVNAFGNTVARAVGPEPTMLSFVQLQRQLPQHEQGGLEEPAEPWNDDSESMAVSAPDSEARQLRGTENITYRFNLADYEPDALLICASKLFPNLCLVLGWVAPSNDEQTSRFIHNGHTLVYRLPAKRTEKLRTNAFRRHGVTDAAAEESAESLWADIEGDWALLDAAVKHWNGKVSRTLKEAKTHRWRRSPVVAPRLKSVRGQHQMTTVAMPHRALGTVAEQAAIMFDYLVECAGNCRVVTYGRPKMPREYPPHFKVESWTTCTTMR